MLIYFGLAIQTAGQEALLKRPDVEALESEDEAEQDEEVLPEEKSSVQENYLRHCAEAGCKSSEDNTTRHRAMFN